MPTKVTKYSRLKIIMSNYNILEVSKEVCVVLDIVKLHLHDKSVCATLYLVRVQSDRSSLN